MEALQHFKVRKSVAHLHGECSEAKQSEKKFPASWMSGCLARVPMSPSSANICPDPSPECQAVHCDQWPIGHNLCDPVFCSQATSIIPDWHRVFIISPIVTRAWLLAKDMCLFVRIEFNSINRVALCLHSLSSSYKKYNFPQTTVRKFNRVWVIPLLQGKRQHTVAMLVSLNNPILFSASINTDYRCPIPMVGLTFSLQTANLILDVHT